MVTQHAEDEFAIIEAFFRPLAADQSVSFQLKDDVALHEGWAITKDVLVEGVHFRSNDPLDLVARKALRVNLSDLAAKGARPIGYLLGCVWTRATEPTSIARFAEGLGCDQKIYGLKLFGGDTTSHVRDGPLIISVTMIGSVSPRGLVLRSGARPGDDVWVTGTIGDSGLGLKTFDAAEPFEPEERLALAQRYQLPDPKVTFGAGLAGIASAAIDVSDGLLADAAHLAKASDVLLEIWSPRLPLSGVARDWLSRHPDHETGIKFLASAGDDYEILFCAGPDNRERIEALSQKTKTPSVRIGAVRSGAGVVLLNAAGDEIRFGHAGYNHFRKA